MCRLKHMWGMRCTAYACPCRRARWHYCVAHWRLQTTPPPLAGMHPHPMHRDAVRGLCVKSTLPPRALGSTARRPAFAMATRRLARLPSSRAPQRHVTTNLSSNGNNTLHARASQLPASAWRVQHVNAASPAQGWVRTNGSLLSQLLAKMCVCRSLKRERTCPHHRGQVPSLCVTIIQLRQASSWTELSAGIVQRIQHRTPCQILLAMRARA